MCLYIYYFCILIHSGLHKARKHDKMLQMLQKYNFTTTQSKLFENIMFSTNTKIYNYYNIVTGY